MARSRQRFSKGLNTYLAGGLSRRGHDQGLAGGVLPGTREELIRRGLFELGDDGQTLVITAKGRAYLRRLERGLQT